MNPSALKGYHAKLNAAESRLFILEPKSVEVCFRDLEVEGAGGS